MVVTGELIVRGTDGLSKRLIQHMSERPDVFEQGRSRFKARHIFIPKGHDKYYSTICYSCVVVAARWDISGVVL